MSKFHCTIAAAVVVVLSWAKAADAQGYVYVAQPVESGGLLHYVATGAHYDMKNQAMAEKRLHLLQAKFDHHVASGHSAAAERDVYLMRNMRFRIVVDEWLIRKNLGMDPGCYPDPLCMDPITYNAIAQYKQPRLFP